jgi:prefoldin beta subunit
MSQMEAYNKLVDEINENRKKMQAQYDLLRQLTSQQSENESVKKEFDQLESDAEIWKQVGLLMVRQDKEDAKQNVEKRIEFIAKDVLTAEEKIKELETEFETKREQLLKMQEQQQIVA